MRIEIYECDICYKKISIEELAGPREKVRVEMFMDEKGWWANLLRNYQQSCIYDMCDNCNKNLRSIIIKFLNEHGHKTQ